MKRKTAIAVLGGKDEGAMSRAAFWLGMTAHAISNWQVDSDDNLTSRRVCDAVLAAVARKLHSEGALELHPGVSDLIELP